MRVAVVKTEQELSAKDAACAPSGKSMPMQAPTVVQNTPDDAGDMLPFWAQASASARSTSNIQIHSDDVSLGDDHATDPVC